MKFKESSDKDILRNFFSIGMVANSIETQAIDRSGVLSR
jgi:hypothetical protein